MAKLNWQAQHHQPHHAWLTLYQELLALRQRIIVPKLKEVRERRFEVLTPYVLFASWQLGDVAQLTVYANLGTTPARLASSPQGDLFYSSDVDVEHEISNGVLPAFSVAWYLKENNEQASK